jgi:hypothetical protein
MNRKVLAIILIVIGIVSVGSVTAYQTLYNLSNVNANISNSTAVINNSNVTIGENNTIIYPNTSPTPILTPTLTPTSSSSLTPTPIQTPNPTPITSPSVNVVVTEYGHTTLTNDMGIIGSVPDVGSTFVCVVTINSPIYNSLLVQLASQNMTVLSTLQTFTWFGNFGINTGAGEVFNVGNGQFTLTLFVASSPSVQYGVVNVQNAVTDGCNSWLSANSP